MNTFVATKSTNNKKNRKKNRQMWHCDLTSTSAGFVAGQKAQLQMLPESKRIATVFPPVTLTGLSVWVNTATWNCILKLSDTDSVERYTRGQLSRVSETKNFLSLGPESGAAVYDMKEPYVRSPLI